VLVVAEMLLVRGSTVALVAEEQVVGAVGLGQPLVVWVVEAVTVMWCSFS
jgi:hypothetical protein